MLNPVPAIEQHPDREEIDQVRSLLFGEMQRDNQRRFAELEAQLRDLRLTMERQMTAMAAEHAASQASVIRAVGDAITQLGQHISRLADRSSRDVTGS